MNGYNFTERVRKVLAMAREEAARLHHEYVGTEHILLGLIREGEGVAAAVLQNLQVDLDEIQQKIEEQVKKGKATQTTGPDLPYTSRAKKVLELAMSEARELNHSYVGTEHLLLGLQREGKGVAIEVLAELGVSEEGARGAVLAALSGEPPARRERPQRRRPRWEYALVPVGSLESADVLEPLGRDGWELVALVGEPPELRAVLKRPG
jgi:ATP-dependent Clp protease ATP-binding subunit ClpC